ncbi:MAG: DUF2157 domain-containing protein [Desulfobulbaceae bacterium]|nr:DUF2157 domain-containing protein [Desulfobulbaceae bacterium]
MKQQPDWNKYANVNLLHKLHQDGLLNDDAFVAAKKILRPSSAWFSWANQLLLIIGVTLVLAGVIFFFAYNWAQMGKFQKFALIELSIVSCIVASFFRGAEQLSGKTLILSASVLCGVLLAVYGQIYQTGADSFELFRGWAFLIFGWVIVSEFAALWFLWLVIVNTGVILFWLQVGEPGHAIDYEWLCLAIGIINSSALALWETGLKKEFRWLTSKWLQPILLITILVSLSIPCIDLIINSYDSYDKPSSITFYISAIWVLATSAGYLYYRNNKRRMTPIALITMNYSVILLTLIGKIMFYNNHGNAGTALLFAFIIICVVGGATVFLKKVNIAMTAKSREIDK